MSESSPSVKPRVLRMHPADNVAIVVNDGGLPAGTVLDSGLELLDKVPQGHKVALVDLSGLMAMSTTALRRASMPSFSAWV